MQFSNSWSLLLLLIVLLLSKNNCSVAFRLTFHVPYSTSNRQSRKEAHSHRIVPCCNRRRFFAIPPTLEDENKEHPIGSSTVLINRIALAKLTSCVTETSARNVLNEALMPMIRNNETNTNHRPLFHSVRIPPGATDRPISDADLALQTGIRGTKFKVTELIETNNNVVDRASIFLLGLGIATSSSAIAANQFLLPIPEILRFVLVWALIFAPLAFIGAGLALPQDNNVAAPLLLRSLQRSLFPSFHTTKRMVQHEAGHFLVAYLLGKPIKAYTVTNAIANAVEFYPLADEDVGKEKARLLGFDKTRSSSTDDSTRSSSSTTNSNSNVLVDKPYFSQDGKGGDLLLERSVFRNEIQRKKNPVETWPYRGLERNTVDELVVISLAGVCAEILGFSVAKGGIADLNQLKLFFANAAEPLSERQMENQVRFAIGYGTTLLRRNLGALDALAAAMEQGATLEECVVAIETSSSTVAVEEDYQERRKEQLMMEGSSLLEKLRIRRKHADILEDRIEGRGGGERRPLFRNAVNDDPLNGALAIAAIFFVWAASGGLSLH